MEKCTGSYHFWHRWIKDYFPALVDRNKWTTKYQDLEIGDLVIISVEHTARSH